MRGQGGPMKISLLSPDVSQNCMARAHLLYRMLSTEHEVEIVGPASAGQVWQPLRGNDEVAIRVIPQRSAREMARHADGDLLYAVKPRPTSLGVALEARRHRNRPLLVDIDDWESGFLYDDVMAMVRSGFRDETKWVAKVLLDVRSPNNAYRTALMERQVRKVDGVTATSTWLAARYGGTVIVQSRDTSALDPDLVDRESARAALGISPHCTVLLFMGTPRRHKGLDKVLAALDVLGRDDLLFLIVGGDPGLPQRPDLQVVGWQPYGGLTRFLSAADLVVVAQESTPGARGQMPTKAYDAMAMGRPVIASDVADLATTVEGCGLVVPPNDVPALAAAIATLADDPGLRARLGAAGRRRCVERYSDKAVRPRLLAALEAAAGGGPTLPTGGRQRASVERRSATQTGDRR
jgi:glycosyltransferase involved in cell wall biosynthesis